jgi:DNA-binding GntR family transcriptional regulator
MDRIGPFSENADGVPSPDEERGDGQFLQFTGPPSGVLNPLQRLEGLPPIRERLRVQIEELIIDGTLAQGTRLVEVDLAARFNVSRGSIREVMQDLARDRFVDARPRLGTFVHAPGPAEIDDFFDILRALEAESSRLAAVRVTTAQAVDLQRLVESSCELVEHPREAGEAGAGRFLHTHIATIARSEILLETLSLYYKKNTWLRSPYRSAGAGRDLPGQHAAIIDAIVRRDAKAAYEATALHVDAARAHYIDLVAAHTSNG